jgi:hypothetical protein
MFTQIPSTDEEPAVAVVAGALARTLPTCQV